MEVEALGTLTGIFEKVALTSIVSVVIGTALGIPMVEGITELFGIEADLTSVETEIPAEGESAPLEEDPHANCDHGPKEHKPMSIAEMRMAHAKKMAAEAAAGQTLSP